MLANTVAQVGSQHTEELRVQIVLMTPGKCAGQRLCRDGAHDVQAAARCVLGKGLPLHTSTFLAAPQLYAAETAVCAMRNYERDRASVHVCPALSPPNEETRTAGLFASLTSVAKRTTTDTYTPSVAACISNYTPAENVQQTMRYVGGMRLHSVLSASANAHAIVVAADLLTVLCMALNLAKSNASYEKAVLEQPFAHRGLIYLFDVEGKQTKNLAYAPTLPKVRQGPDARKLAA